MLILWIISLVVGVSAELIQDEDLAAQWFSEFDALQSAAYTKSVQAAWNYDTNLTDYNLNKQLEVSLDKAKLLKEGASNASRYDWKNFQDEDLKRKFSKIAIIGLASLEPEKVGKANSIQGEMIRVYSTSKVCDKPGDASGECYPLGPDLIKIMSSSRDWDELLWAWEGWREVTGKIKSDYIDYVELHNEAAQKEGFEDTGDYWRSWYESETFDQDVAEMWEQLKPMYQQLHYYVKSKLKGIHSNNSFPSSGHIPAHILGNMWAMSWTELYDDLVPYEGKESVDVTQSLVDQGFDAKRMFEISEEFFTSLGLIATPQSFWNLSMIEKPDDRDVVCHASAWDFYDGEDVRIMQCTAINHQSLVTVHHEMGHIQYYLQYKDQPTVYRDGANPGFHEAVGDILALSVATPKHLKEIGLLDKIGEDTESEINFLFFTALRKIAFLPFGYLLDQWRWDVFRDNIKPDDYTEAWASLRCKLQGVSPPVMRTKDHFDPAALYHIPGNTPYIRYFVSRVLSFQFHKTLCEVAGHRGPLHQCDIYKSKKAGQLLSNMLKLGSSKPWPDAMEQITGQRLMSADALVEYFAPLTEWLKEQNGDADVSWEEECPPGSFQEDQPTEQPSKATMATIATINTIIMAFVMYMF